METREAAGRDRAYAGVRAGGFTSVCWAEGDKGGDLALRLDLCNHSPGGFEWGYEGSGPARLALALLADATGDDDLALRVHQKFKAEIIGAITGDEWTLEAGMIADFATSLFVGEITPV